MTAKFLLPANKSDANFVISAVASIAIGIAKSSPEPPGCRWPDVRTNHMICRDLRVARNLRHCALHFLFRLF
jgi:hypothetical protein